MLQVSKTQFFAYFNYNVRIIQISPVSKTQFLTRLLALLASCLCVFLMVILVGLTVGLAISGVESRDEKVAVGFFGYFM